MRPRLIGLFLLGGLAAAAPLPAFAQQDCLVRSAADAAVQRQIALIDAAKVNPSSFFNGANSCVAGDLLRRFDLSNLIPDLSGFLTSGAQGLLDGAINAARQQACRILDDQLRDVIRNINTNMTGFQGQASGDLFRQLNGSVSPITLPNINNLGRYDFVPNTASGPVLPADGAASTVSAPMMAAPTTASPIFVPAPSSVGTPSLPGSAFGGMNQ